MLIFEDIADKLRDKSVYISVNGDGKHKIDVETAKICYGGNRVTGIYATSKGLVVEVHSNFNRQGEKIINHDE